MGKAVEHVWRRVLMKRKDLEGCRALVQELETLEEKYLKAKPGENVGDTYGDYRSGYKVTKVMYGKSSKRAKQLQEKIFAKANKLRNKIYEIEIWLDDIDDSFMRDVIRLYYVCGETQEEIGRRKHYSQQRINQRIEEFWQEYETASDEAADKDL